MDELFTKKPSEALLMSEYAMTKLTEADISTTRQLVTMSIAEAHVRLGRKAYREILETLNEIGLGFEMADVDVETWKPRSS